MASRTGSAFFSWRMPVLLLALVVLTTGFSAAFTPVAVAQDSERKPWSLRDLFSPRKSSRVEPSANVRKPQTRKKPKSSAKATRSSRSEPRALPAPVVVKEDDARTVLVIGDFLASGIAEGLTEVFTENPRVKIVDRSSGSSGFVRDDFHDWPKKAADYIERDKPAAAVIMLGANDRQQMRVNGTREQVRSENWSKEYSARTAALAKVFADNKVPFVWVGVPAFRFTSMTSDMLAFNDFYRTAAKDVGAEFIDIWDGFVDENGAYVSSGPDMNGQPVRLRAEDGINLTSSGKRKVAFYAEKALFKVLGETGTPGAAPVVPALPAAPAVPIDVSKIDRTQPVSLTDPELDGGTELLGLVAEPKHDVHSPGEKLAIDGIAPDALPGRADDFSWPPKPAAAATAGSALPPPANEAERTTAITP